LTLLLLIILISRRVCWT